MNIKVYEPCPHCQGQGWYVQPPANQWTIPNFTGVRIVCEMCNGTGKGKVKEIRDEQRPHDPA